MIIKNFLFSQLRYISTLLSIIIVMTGCGGVVREQVYAPMAPVVEQGAVQQIHHEMARSEKYWRVSFNTGDVILTVYPVDLSEKMIMLIGPLVILPTPFAEKTINDEPLSIKVKIDIQQGTVSFNSRDCVISLNENDREFEPVSVKKIIYHPGESEPKLEEVTGPVILTKQPDIIFFTFTYDILRTNLPLFVFRFGTFSINGRNVNFQELPFELKSAYSSR